MKNKTLKKQLPQNLVLNVLSFAISIVIGLWLVPYLVKYIGTAAYGLVPLAMVFTEYISVINVSINSSISRFITLDIQKNDWQSANHTFNTAFFALLAIIAIQIPFLSYIIIDITHIINVPDDLITDVYYLFGFTFAGYLTSLFSSIFGTSMFAYNRLDLSRSIGISRLLVRVIFIVLTFTFIDPSLMFVGIGNFLGALVSFFFSWYYWRKITPKLKIKIAWFRRSILRRLLDMGGWLMINKVGYLLYLKIDLFVINHYLGPEPGGTYAAVQQWNTLIRTLASVLADVISPMILISFAQNKLMDVIRFGKLGVEFLALLIGITTGIICGFAPQLLNLWLGENFVQYSSLLFIMLFHFVVNLSVTPLFPINTALNKVRLPGIITLAMGGLNLTLAIVFITRFDYGIYGVAMAGAIVLTLKHGLFTPFYAAHILNIKALNFFKPLFGGIVIFALTYFAAKFTGDFYAISSWTKLVLFSALLAFIATILSWFLLISSKNKKMLIDLLPLKVKKILGQDHPD